MGEEAVRTAANSIGIVLRNNELRGKNIESTRVVLRKSLDGTCGGKVWKSKELFRKGEGIAPNSWEGPWNSTVAIGFAEEPD